MDTKRKGLRWVYRCAQGGTLTHLLILSMLVGGFAFGQAPRSQSVLVTITTQGIYLSSPSVKPGTVTFVVVNRTTATNPEFEILPSTPGAAVSSRLQGLRTSRRVVHSVTLGVGTYTIRLKDIPSNKAEFKVAP